MGDTLNPVVILDSTAVHGRRPFTRADSALLLALVRTGRIRLVIPEVVLYELSRQWAKDLADRRRDFRKAHAAINGVLADADVATVTSSVAPSLGRSVFYDAAATMLTRNGVEVPRYPEVPLGDLLERDLDERKPFASTGKGFRDALIWETVKVICAGVAPSTPVLFVTNNSGDFCVSKRDRTLHPDLRAEMPDLEAFEVVPFLRASLEHGAIKPLAEVLRVVEGAFTAQHVADLVKTALQGLEGAVPEPDFDLFGDDDRYEHPFRTSLSDAVFDRIFPDMGTIGYEVYHTGDQGEMTLTVGIEADCSLDGFIDRNMGSADGYAYYEDWSREMLRVIEHPRRARFVLSAAFTAATIDSVELTVDEVEEITLLTPLATHGGARELKR
ncbi:hypothetical protein DCE93_06575 [Agromyces badenianii]|uniref:DUF4935 domain-containing protein n=1 Tax=Agromyces badenianii TaxID=2080742 RepID=A0A2S0WVM0_9MICO|nr:PIN domain-containing protein [Agromyces badenianii]AWB95362.1 hypothetical protein DCE93_06575 [Agromyces badenianii]